jgi:cytochrome c biogenesis protein ResB
VQKFCFNLLGKIVDVEYMSYKTMGMNVVEVRLFDPKGNPNKFGQIINKVAMILFVISAIIMVVGIVQII